MANERSADPSAGGQRSDGERREPLGLRKFSRSSTDNFRHIPSARHDRSSLSSDLSYPTHHKAPFPTLKFVALGMYNNRLCPFRAYQDTGATHNLMMEDVAARIGWHRIDWEGKATFRGLGNNKVEAIGRIEVTFRLVNQGRWHTTTFYVLSRKDSNGTYDVLLSAQFIYEAGYLVPGPGLAPGLS